MSYNSNRKKLLDESEKLERRASHARSCALHVANKLGVKREAVIEMVAQKTAIDLHDPKSSANLLIAFEALDEIRKSVEA